MIKLAYSHISPAGEVQRNLPPIIMLHGMLDTRKTWMQLAPKIANQTGRKVYCLDARNHGESPWTEDFDFDFMAKDVDNFMTEHHIRKATLLGHSMGGKTIMKFATERPEKVEKLIVEDMIPKPLSMRAWGVVVIALILLRESLTAIPEGADTITAKKAVRHFMFDHLPDVDLTGHSKNPELGLQIMPLKKVNSHYQWETNLDVLEKTLTTNERFDLPLNSTYTGDALFIYGTKSFIKMANHPSIPKYFPNAKILPVEGASHLVHYDHPDEFLQGVVNFINGGNNPPPVMPPSKY